MEFTYESQLTGLTRQLAEAKAQNEDALRDTITKLKAANADKHQPDCDIFSIAEICSCGMPNAAEKP